MDQKLGRGLRHADREFKSGVGYNSFRVAGALDGFTRVARSSQPWAAAIPLELKRLRRVISKTAFGYSPVFRIAARGRPLEKKFSVTVFYQLVPTYTASAR